MLRVKPIPLKELIPVMQRAADHVDFVERELARVKLNNIHLARLAKVQVDEVEEAPK